MPFITPSTKLGVTEEEEMWFRQKAANLIEQLGKKLVSYLPINTAIVYMHRFYMSHSFTLFSWETVAIASLFLAAKVEEQPCRLRVLVVKLNDYIHGKQPTDYEPQIEECLMIENLLLLTLGFDLHVTQPHTFIVRSQHDINVPKFISKPAYFLASYVLQLTVICVQHNPSIIACFCIHLASKWSDYNIPNSNEGQEWYYIIDRSVTETLLNDLTIEFEEKMTKCPTKLKESITNIYNNCKENYYSKHSSQESSQESNGSPAILKRTHSPERNNGVNNGTYSDTKQSNDPNEPLPKIFRTVHPRDPRKAQFNLKAIEISETLQSEVRKMAHPRDPRKVIPRVPKNAQPIDTMVCPSEDP